MPSEPSKTRSAKRSTAALRSARECQPVAALHEVVGAHIERAEREGGGQWPGGEGRDNSQGAGQAVDHRGRGGRQLLPELGHNGAAELSQSAKTPRHCSVSAKNG